MKVVCRVRRRVWCAEREEARDRGGGEREREREGYLCTTEQFGRKGEGMAWERGGVGDLYIRAGQTSKDPPSPLFVGIGSWEGCVCIVPVEFIILHARVFAHVCGFFSCPLPRRKFSPPPPTPPPDPSQHAGGGGVQQFVGGWGGTKQPRIPRVESGCVGDADSSV